MSPFVFPFLQFSPNLSLFLWACIFQITFLKHSVSSHFFRDKVKTLCKFIKGSQWPISGSCLDVVTSTPLTSACQTFVHFPRFPSKSIFFFPSVNSYSTPSTPRLWQLLLVKWVIFSFILLISLSGLNALPLWYSFACLTYLFLLTARQEKVEMELIHQYFPQRGTIGSLGGSWKTPCAAAVLTTVAMLCMTSPVLIYLITGCRYIESTSIPPLPPHLRKPQISSLFLWVCCCLCFRFHT